MHVGVKIDSCLQSRPGRPVQHCSPASPLRWIVRLESERISKCLRKISRVSDHSQQHGNEAETLSVHLVVAAATNLLGAVSPRSAHPSGRTINSPNLPSAARAMTYVFVSSRPVDENHFHKTTSSGIGRHWLMSCTEVGRPEAGGRHAGADLLARPRRRRSSVVIVIVVAAVNISGTLRTRSERRLTLMAAGRLPGRSLCGALSAPPDRRSPLPPPPTGVHAANLQLTRP